MRHPLLLLSLLTLLAPAGTAQEPSVEEALKEGRRLSAQHLYKEAAAAFEKGVRAAPADWRPYHEAATAWSRIRRFPRATELLRTARQLAPDRPEVVHDLASVLYNQALWSESIVYWRELMALAGRNEEAAQHWEIPYHLGLCAERIDLMPEAIKAWRQALDIVDKGGRDEVVARTRLGGALLNTGESKEAAEHFRRLVALEPSNAEHHYYLGAALMNLDEDEKAEEHLLEALRRNPKDERPPLKLGKLHQRRGELLKALSYFRLASEKNPEAYEPWYGMRTVHARLNDMDAADKAQERYDELYAKGETIENKLREYYRLEQSDPHDTKAWLEHALLLLQNNRLGEGMEKLQQLLAVDPGNELGIINLAQTLALMGQTQAAVYEMDKVLERDADHPVANLESAKALARLGRWPDALPRVLRAFKRLDRTNVDRYLEAVQMLAAATVRAGQPDKALPELEAASQRFEGDAEHLLPCLQLLAQIASRAGQPNRALERLERSLPVLGQDHPDYKSLVQLLVVLSRQAHDQGRELQYTELLKSLK